MQGSFFTEEKQPVRKQREGQRDPKRDKTRKKDFTKQRSNKRDYS